MSYLPSPSSTRCQRYLIRSLMRFGAQLLQLFVTETGSEVAGRLLDDWPTSAGLFVKVFPYEYQKALQRQQQKEQEEEQEQQEHKPAVVPVSVPEVAKNGVHGPVLDIEDAVQDEPRRQEKLLDKTRGFIKYERQRNAYRPAEKRIKDWEEMSVHYRETSFFPYCISMRRLLGIELLDWRVPEQEVAYGVPLPDCLLFRRHLE